MTGLGGALAFDVAKDCFGMSVWSLRFRMSRESRTTDILGVCYNHCDSSLRKTGDIRWADDGVRAHGSVEVFVWEDLRG